MSEEIQKRFESKSFCEGVQQSSFSFPSYESVTGYLSLRQPSESPLATIELDEDSFWLAYFDSSSFVEYALGAYASRNADYRATVYTYSTGRTPSVNISHGESHQRNGWHNAVFFGVVGRKELLETIKFTLLTGAGVPEDVMRLLTVNAEKRSQVYCDHCPDYIQFSRMGKASYHIEDGLVWSPHEESVWYSHSDWRPNS